MSPSYHAHSLGISWVQLTLGPGPIHHSPLHLVPMLYPVLTLWWALAARTDLRPQQWPCLLFSASKKFSIALGHSLSPYLFLWKVLLHGDLAKIGLAAISTTALCNQFPSWTMGKQVSHLSSHACKPSKRPVVLGSRRALDVKEGFRERRPLTDKDPLSSLPLP